MGPLNLTTWHGGYGPQRGAKGRSRYNRVMNPGLFDELKAYVGFGARDAANVRALAEPVRPLIPRVVNRFYEALLENRDARAVLGDEDQIQRLKRSLDRWLRELFAGLYDQTYYQSRFRIGKVHVQVGLPQRFMPLAMDVVRAELARGLRDAGLANSEEKLESLQKLLTLDLTIMLGSYQESYLEKIREGEQHAMDSKLARAQHLAEIGQLAASLAHEIKN